MTYVKTQTIRVTLNNSAGPLDEEIATVVDGRDDSDDVITAAVQRLAARCIFAEGDTITIREVE